MLDAGSSVTGEQVPLRSKINDAARYLRTPDGLDSILNAKTERGYPSALYIRVAAAFPSAAIRSVCRFGFRQFRVARKMPAVGWTEPRA